MSRPYETPYNIGLLDDLHNFFPAILYEPDRFQNVPELLLYITRQTAHHMNIYTRSMRAYRSAYGIPPPVDRNIPVVPVGPVATAEIRTETFDLTPMFGGNNLAIADVLALLRGGLGGAIPTAPLEPVIVRPTQAQIDSATTLGQADEDADVNQHSCAVCQENFTEGQAIRSINHCSHEFHKICIDEWFNRNVRCPVCRHDIREA
jgi:hypothetical protein